MNLGAQNGSRETQNVLHFFV